MAAIDVEELEQARRDRIEYNLPDRKPFSALEAEREKHRRRASKFGGEYVEPSCVSRELALEARKERHAGKGFATGIDVFSKEEAEKRNARASRFNIIESRAPKYAPDEEELAKAARAKKFGVEGYEPASSAMMDMDLFEERQEVAKDVERRPNSIYLYGVDVMSTRDCLQYFGEYGPTFIEWINDSSCVVVFRDEHSARRAMAGVGRPLPSEEMAGESSTGLDAFDPANMPYFWHKGQDFVKEGTPVHLIFRMATVDDKKDIRAPRKTRELWKQPHQHQQGGPRKARRTGTQQQQQRQRVDGDGDVAMGEGGGDEGGDGAQRDRGGRRRRKQRNANGTQLVVHEDGDVAMDEANESVMGKLGEDRSRRQGRKIKDRKQAPNYQLWGSRAAEEQGQLEQQSEQKEGREVGSKQEEDKPVVDAETLLRRIVHARRGSKKGKANADGALAVKMPWPGAPQLVHLQPVQTSVQPEPAGAEEVAGTGDASESVAVEGGEATIEEE